MNASVRILTAFNVQRSTPSAHVNQSLGRRLAEPSNMRVLKPGAIFTSIAAVLLLLAATCLGPEPYARTPISADDFARAVTMHCESLIELYLTEHRNPNARVAQGCTLLLIAALQQDRETVRRLLDAGARVNIADKT